MNWSLIGRCGLRYTLVYAGVTVVAVFGYTRSSLALIGLLGLGFATIAVAFGGSETVRSGSSMMLQNGDIASTREPSKQLTTDIKLFFYGIGLLVCTLATLVVVG